MANVRLQAKFDTAVARANLAQSYRTMARVMVTSESRDRLLSMAKKLENRSRNNNATSTGGED
jgi:hypothetical protein